MNKITLNTLKLTQNDETFYMGKILAKDLISIATIHFKHDKSSKQGYIKEVEAKLSDDYTIEDLGEENSIQRKLQLDRLKKIANYINKDSGLFPNSLIIAINNKRGSSNDGYIVRDGLIPGITTIEINSEYVDVYIVDGQHRLASFTYVEEDIVKEFEFPVSIFLDIEIPLQAELFSTINSTQKPVNKSILYDLSELKNEYTTLKKCHSYAKWFNNKEMSPLKNKIKMLGTGTGVLSQSAFIDAILPYFERQNLNFLANLDDKAVLELLYVYFESFKNVFPEAWSNSRDYLLLKTTGFSAIIKALYYIYFKVINENGGYREAFNINNVSNEIRQLKPSISFSSDMFPKTAGKGPQSILKDIILARLFKDENFQTYDDNNTKDYKDYIKDKEREYEEIRRRIF